jgi:hypothetical protein
MRLILPGDQLSGVFKLNNLEDARRLIKYARCAEDIGDFSDCLRWHPTGQEGSNNGGGDQAYDPRD